MQIDAALEQIKRVVGPSGWIAEPAECEPYLRPRAQAATGDSLFRSVSATSRGRPV
jgi:hypothetical protein